MHVGGGGGGPLTDSGRGGKFLKCCSWLFFVCVGGQMWSSADTRPSTSLLMLGGGSESEGEGPAPGEKSQLIETTIISPQEEEVELLTHQEQ